MRRRELVWRFERGRSASAENLHEYPWPSRVQMISFMDPGAVLSLVDRPGIDALASEVKGRLERVRDSLAA